MASPAIPIETSTYDPGNELVSPAIGSPSPSSLDLQPSAASPSDSGGIFQSLGSGVQGLSNVGLQWFTAVTKGVSSPLVTPQPVQATPGAAAASLVNQITSYIPWILIIIAVIIAAKIFMKVR